jgi:hypothetical protein
MTAPHSATNVRLTSPRAKNALGYVRRISVTGFLVAGLWMVAASSANAADKNPDSWNIRILPATKLMLAQATPKAPAPVPQEPAATTTKEPAAPRTYEEAPRAAGELRIVPGPTHSVRAAAGRPGYADVYRSIPFSRAEYVAHPTYRSEATLGLMLNQMPYPATSPPVPQYGYVTPYQFDNTFGTPTFSNTFYAFPLSEF